MMKAVLIQARMSSSRFPRKMLQPVLGDISLVEYVYRRCRYSRRADIVAVLTSEERSDDELAAHCLERGLSVYRGALNNVLQRYVSAAEHFKAEAVCRVCGDTPFVNVDLMDAAFDILSAGGSDYAAPARSSCAPGFYSEVVSSRSLQKALELATSADDLEHVTKFILEHQELFKLKLLDADLNPGFLEGVRFTVDMPEDIELCRRIASGLPADLKFAARDVLGAIQKIKGH